MAASLRLDLDELLSLREAAKRARVQDALDSAIAGTRTALAAADKAESSQPAAPSEEPKTSEVAAPEVAAPEVAAAEVAAPEASVPAAPAVVLPPPAAKSSALLYTAIPSFGFDAGGYGEPWVTLYIDLPGVGEVKDAVEVKSISLKSASKSLSDICSPSCVLQVLEHLHVFVSPALSLPFSGVGGDDGKRPNGNNINNSNNINNFYCNDKSKPAAATGARSARTRATGSTSRCRGSGARTGGSSRPTSRRTLFPPSAS